MRHQLRFLTVLLLSLVVGMVSAQTLIQRQTSYDGLSYSFNDDNYLTLNNGTRLLLRAAGSGNHDYYFAGAAVKTTDAATAEVYVVESVGTYDFTDTNDDVKTVSTFRLKRESDNNYVKAPTATSGSIEMTTTQSEAAVFFAFNPDGVNAAKPSTSAIWTEVQTTNNIVRLQVTNIATYLNAGAIKEKAAWANGTGGLSIWVLYIAPEKTSGGDSGDSGETTDETTAEELQAAIDKANALFAKKALITDASQFSSDHKESTEGSYEGLLADYSLGTGNPYFFHSNWSDENDKSADNPHDLQVVQFDNADDLATFTVKYKARNGNNRPTNINVYGGTYDNSKTTWETTSFTTLTSADGLNEDEGEFSFTADKAYNAFRFVVTATNTGTVFFTYGRFQLYGTDYTTTDGFTADADDIATLVTAIKSAQSAMYTGSGYGEALKALNEAYDNFYAAAGIAKQQLQSAIDDCTEELTDAQATAGTPGYASTENLNTLNEAIATAQALVDADASTDEEYVTAKTTLLAAAETALQNAISYPTDYYFTITNDRGSLVYDESQALSSDNEAFVWYTGSVDASNPNHLWGFYKDETTGNYYLYNVGAKLFASSNGTGSYGKTWVLAAEGSPIALSLTWNNGNTIGSHKVSIKGDDRAMSISTGFTGPVITYYADGDGGVPFLFAKSDYAFDQTLYDNFKANAERQAELNSLIAQAKQVYAEHPNYEYKKGDKLILDASQFNSNNKEQSEGSYAALLDGNASTYFHSNWSTGGGEEPHDLQVTFENTDNQLTYVVEYEARKNNGAYTTGTRPAQISIYGGTYTDGSVTWNTTPFVTLTTANGLAEEKGSFSFTADKTYNALRFAVDKTNGSWDNNYVYFTYGEFQLYPAEASSLNLSILAGLERTIEAAESATYEDISDDQTYYDLYYTLVDAMDDVLTNYDVVTLNADIAEAREKYAAATAKQGVPGYLDDEAAEIFAGAIEHADEVVNEITSTRDDLAEASTALASAVEKYYGNSWVSYPETSYFVITNARGSIVFDPEHATTSNTKGKSELRSTAATNAFIWYAAEPDETDPNNLWGFLTNATTGEHYLYNVGQELFANCDGQGSYTGGTTWILSDQASPITMTGLDFPTLRIMSGDNTMSVSTSYNGPIISYYADGDGGVPFSFAKSSVEFDESLYQAMADLAGVVTGVGSASTTSSLSVSGGHGSLTVTSSVPATVSVTALSGVVVAHTTVGAGSSTTIALPAGIYVVAGQKVVVK